MHSHPTFPPDFVWGAAAAAYQVEGAAFEDGKGPSVWDMFTHRPGAVWQGQETHWFPGGSRPSSPEGASTLPQTGDIACDHYHRYPEDVRLMALIGLRAYRLSISWPRVLPGGIGAVNPAGLDFYDRLVDTLLAAGVQPWVTLFHWDFPYALYCRGGWLNPDSPAWFAEYASLLVRRLGDRVRHWITLNEPQVFVVLGHAEGRHAPGDKLGWPEVLRTAHHALLAHGRAVQAIRAATPASCEIGFSTAARVRYPATGSPADTAAARRATFENPGRDLWSNTWFSDPIFFKQYPADALAQFGGDMPEIGPEDMDLIGQPVDFYGVNIYTGIPVRANATGAAEVVPFPAGHPRTAFHWPVTPEALYWGARFLWDHYKKPIVITENGMSNVDWVSSDGKVHDPQRIDYTGRYLETLRRAIGDGVDARGYFHWSLMDNFEWAEGFKERFGLVYVDYSTQRRILKDSAYWYRDVIATNGANL